MTIYGVALLAACFLVGQLLGNALGYWLGVGGNVGGVGFSMALLILLNDFMHRRDALDARTEQGVLFWSAMYIPIVVAMSATQNVRAALTGGWVAAVVGVLATVGGLALVPVLARLGRQSTPSESD